MKGDTSDDKVDALRDGDEDAVSRVARSRLNDLHVTSGVIKDAVQPVHTALRHHHQARAVVAPGQVCGVEAID